MYPKKRLVTHSLMGRGAKGTEVVASSINKQIKRKCIHDQNAVAGIQKDTKSIVPNLSSTFPGVRPKSLVRINTSPI
jgi:hypothetical protein